MKWPFCFQCALREARGSVQAARTTCAFCPPRTRQCPSKICAGSLCQPPREPVAPALPSWFLLVSSLVAETPHQPSAPLISLKPRRASAPWGGGSRRGTSQLSAARDCVCSCPQEGLGHSGGIYCGRGFELRGAPTAQRAPGIPQYLPVLPTGGSLLLARYKREMRKTMPWDSGWLGGNSALLLWAKEGGLPGTVTPRSGTDCQ